MSSLNTTEILELLEHGELEMEGLVPWGSNYTFLVRLCYQGVEENGIYKPQRGERPLWDFAQGTLCQRERAAFLVSDALGWNLVPPTLLRDGPHGWGSVQFFVQHDPDQHYFTIEGHYREQVQQIVLLDYVINNADRKAGHVLVDDQEHLWAIDHGVCFHVDYKLRSVIWEYAGQKIPSNMLHDLKEVQAKLAQHSATFYHQLSTLISAVEIRALRERVDILINQPIFPEPGTGRHYPWPLV